MVRLGEPRAIEPPPKDDWARRSYPAPTGDYTLSFSDGGEYAMGASFWKTNLLGPKGHRSKLPYALAVAPLAPWSPDGTAFAYLATLKLREDGRLLLGHVGKGVRWPVVPTWAEGIFWSPTRAVLLVIGKGWLRLLDRDGRIAASRDWSMDERDRVYGGWFASGERFFVVGRGMGTRTSLRVFDAKASELGEESLDPADLVPFDAKAFEPLERKTYSLRIGPGTRAIAALLDRWSDVRYDRLSGQLQLAVYRPTGPLERESSPAFAASGGIWTAPASIRWIAVPMSE